MKKLLSWFNGQPKAMQALLAGGVPLVALAAILQGRKRAPAPDVTDAAGAAAQGTIYDGYVGSGVGSGVDTTSINQIYGEIGNLANQLTSVADSAALTDQQLASQIEALATNTPTLQSTTTIIQQPAAAKPLSPVHLLPVESLMKSCSDNAIKELLRRKHTVNDPRWNKYPRCAKKYALAVYGTMK